MPNWCVGELKTRGTKENIIKFILEGLQPVDGLGRYRDKLSLITEEGYKYIYSKGKCWIKGTRRGFIEGIDFSFENEEDGVLVKTFDSKFAWEIDAKQLLHICKEYDIDMKIHGFERGMEFNQIIEIIDRKIIKDKKLHFEDYDWNCINSKLGG